MTIAVKSVESLKLRVFQTRTRYCPPPKCQTGERSGAAGIVRIVMKWMKTMNMCQVALVREKSQRSNRYHTVSSMHNTRPIKSIALGRLMPIALAAVCSIAYASCNNDGSHQQWQERQDRYCAERITKFNYEGHSYLKFTGGKYDSVGITHDENCRCRSQTSTDRNQSPTSDLPCPSTPRQSSSHLPQD